MTGVLVAVPSFPSFAATSTVASIGALQTALADCATAPDTIVLGADISAPTTGLTVACDTTLDLSTFNLAVSNVVITSGHELTVAGPTDGTGGTLTANARNIALSAGITNHAATLTVTGGTVTATGGASAAGIGGDPNQGRDGGTLNVAGGTVNAAARTYSAAVGGAYPRASGGTVNVSSGALNAVGEGPYSVAVGGSGGGASGTGGAGATVTVTGGILTARVDDSNGTAIGGGVAGLNITDRAGSGGVLNIGADGEVIATAPRNAVGSGWNLLADSINGDFGSVDVDGILRLPSGRLWVGTNPGDGAEVTVGPGGRILGSAIDPAVGAGIEGPGAIDNQGIITLAPTGTVTGNNKLVRFSPTAPSIRVFAPSLQSGARVLPTAPAGTLWNTAPDGSGTWFASTSSTAGSGTVDLYAVVPASIAVSTDPAKLAATAGEAFTFPVTVNGPSGAALIPQPDVSYTSPDCTIGAGAVFTVAKSCSITASTAVQGVPLQKTFTIRVAPGPLASLVLAPDTGSVTQGDTKVFVLTGADAVGNPVPTTAAVLTSSAAADTVDGRTVSFSGAGLRTMTASLSGVTTTASIDVLAGPLAELTLSPARASVVQGQKQDFVITGEDAAGNPLDTGAAVLTSSNGADTVSGRSVTFSGVGDHQITATQGTVSTSATVSVSAVPSPGGGTTAAPRGLASTGTDGGTAIAAGTGSLALLLAGGSLLLTRTRRRFRR